MTLPYGGRDLVEMRSKGKRPPGFIAVTERKDVAASFGRRGLFALTFQPGRDYDWTLLHGLDVAIVTWLPREKVTDMCVAILAVAPRSFNATYHGKYETEHDHVIPYGVLKK